MQFCCCDIGDGGTLAKSFALGQGTPPGQSPPRSGIAELMQHSHERSNPEDRPPKSGMAELMQGGLWPSCLPLGKAPHLAKVPPKEKKEKKEKETDARPLSNELVAPRQDKEA